MKIYLFRIKKEDAQLIKDFSTIPFDYSPIEIKGDDKLIVFTSTRLLVIGEYKKVDEKLVLIKKAKNNDLRNFIGQLSFVKKKTPKAYKVFAKKIRELTEQDYELIVKEF